MSRVLLIEDDAGAIENRSFLPRSPSSKGLLMPVAARLYG